MSEQMMMADPEIRYKMHLASRKKANKKLNERRGKLRDLILGEGQELDMQMRAKNKFYQ
jgi:hypothetical protein